MTSVGLCILRVAVDAAGLRTLRDQQGCAAEQRPQLGRHAKLPRVPPDCREGDGTIAQTLDRYPPAHRILHNPETHTELALGRPWASSSVLRSRVADRGKAEAA